ncbi:beta-N-acetylglucosaminidase domain-containing protein [Paenibacillus polymyxa]|uniref:protein O-GlcNAcase n=1 Tax=Paenibacillus polymyxa TaxID=1406 RepID=UPI002023D560|nr:beta-N-acetylglucosaminidase domain-containing protein [Paenibacillus polymyxa]URJ47532.1 beta-N-acetylglucosaminidase domain-containing protein [Paenibacillus polymyxa]
MKLSKGMGFHSGVGLSPQEIQYYFRDVYDSEKRLVISEPRLICELSSRFAMNQEYEGVLDPEGPIKLIVPPGPGVPTEARGSVQLVLEYDGTLAADGYRLDIQKDGRIEIHASNKRGLKYGMDALHLLLQVEQERCTLPVMSIRDEPSFPVRGIIEGFYGKPWSFADRLDAVRFMAAHRMNTFMYAPKDDPYHRELWREPYPEDTFAQIRELKEGCERYEIDFHYCISPGNDLSFGSDEDFLKLTEKLAAVIAIGVRHFSVLMDDIDYVLKGENRHLLGRSGHAHVFLTNKVHTWLAERLPEFTLTVCPSEYWSYWDTEYKKDFRERLHPEIKVFWTGYFVFAPQISREHAADNHAFFGHELWLWDNIPVNDCDHDRLFLDPLRGRYSGLPDCGHTGMVANPMNQWECSKVTLITMSHFMWNSERYMPERSWEWAAQELAGERADELMFFCRQNRNSRLGGNVYEDVDLALQMRDIPALDMYFERLLQAVSVLRNVPADDPAAGFVSQAAPWLERAELDAGLWHVLRQAALSGERQDDAQSGESSMPSEAVDGQEPPPLTDEIAGELRRGIIACLETEARLGSNPAIRAAAQWGYVDQDEQGKYRLIL